MTAPIRWLATRSVASGGAVRKNQSSAMIGPMSNSSPQASMAEKVDVVENGEFNELMVEAFANDERFRRMDGSVETVSIVSPAEAEVVYSLSRNDMVVLPGGQVRAVLQDGVWKI
ncbi:hypothetical protein ACTMTI_44440 [Nonomuraea sp. H19]|uniref:hypothetical protein n=1 Tax=Nonomuraea sp. H19 TaxID=3452206 RepID=UPI003F88FF5C